MSTPGTGQSAEAASRYARGLLEASLDPLVTADAASIKAGLRRGGRVESGFGLFSIQERIGLLGGSLAIDSAPGKGSRFILRAPFSPAAA